MKIGDIVVCQFGTEKGTKFIIRALLKDNWFSCQREDKENDRYYGYHERHLKLEKEI